MQFEFATTQRILFGRGAIEQLPSLAAEYGRRVLLVIGSHTSNIPFQSYFPEEKGWQIFLLIAPAEPELRFIQSNLTSVFKFKPDLVVSMGGGSVLDSGKAFAALYTNPGEMSEYIEVVGKGQPLQNEPLPHIAVPTTAGTGSEVTRNAVLALPEMKIKASLRSIKLLPSIALVDPDLTRSVPPNITAATGMDALTQVIEPVISRRANPITDAFCMQAIPLIMQSLPLLMRTPDDMVLREQMSLASLYGGLALANSGLGVIHGFAAAIGGMYAGIGHASICAAILPAGFKENRIALQRSIEHQSLFGRMEAISLLLTSGASKFGEEALQNLANHLQCPGLAALGVSLEDADEIIARVLQSSSYKGNPIELSTDALRLILTESM